MILNAIQKTNIHETQTVGLGKHANSCKTTVTAPLWVQHGNDTGFNDVNVKTNTCNDLPDILVPLDVDFVELPFNRGDDVCLHLHGYVLRQDRQQEPLLQTNCSYSLSDILKIGLPLFFRNIVAKYSEMTTRHKLNTLQKRTTFMTKI
jgi:hypothetical protein